MSVRLVKVPDGAPPYDCETHGTACPAVRAVAGTAHEAGGGPRSLAASRSFAASRSVLGRTAPGAADSSGVLPWQFAQVIVEIMAGLRSRSSSSG